MIICLHRYICMLTVHTSFVVVELNCNFLENICGYVHGKVLCSQTVLYRSIIAISLEKFCGYQSICKNCETFPPQMICNKLYGSKQMYSYYAQLF